MNYSRSDAGRPSELHAVAEDAVRDWQAPAHESFWKRRKTVFRQYALDRKKLRDGRDLERGYRINVKQVVLAFTIEFFIIAIGLAGWYLFSPEAMLYPAALALVELARVPLAIAVRTQKSWNIQFAALLGVVAAVVVTSATLYQIGELTFSPRRSAVFEKLSAAETAKEERKALATRKAEAQSVVDQINADYNSIDSAHIALAKKLNDQSAFSQNCTTTETPNADGNKTTRKSCIRDPAFIALEKQVAAAKLRRDEAFKARTDWQNAVNRFDVASLDKAVSKAEAEHREAILKSPLHSYAAMLFGKDQKDISEGEVKTLEWYLLLIPSIAAALSSTLIAMTSVHRIRPPIQTITTLPDEAASHLFGPLLEAIRAEAKATVLATMKESPKVTVPPEKVPLAIS